MGTRTASVGGLAVGYDLRQQYRFGMPFFIPVEYLDTRVQINDNLSVIKGDHSIKIGGEYFGITLGARKRFADNWGFQVNYTLAFDKSDDDNERDPFSFRYAKITDLDAEWGWSDRDQRHRFNASFLTKLPGEIDVNFRYSYRSATPLSLTETGAVANTPADRINADGSVTQRNTGRKDTAFSGLDLRAANYSGSGSSRLEVICEVFNLFNSNNFIAPQVTNLVFNFDGTIRNGAGNARVAQLGAKYVF